MNGCTPKPGFIVIVIVIFTKKVVILYFNQYQLWYIPGGIRSATITIFGMQKILKNISKKTNILVVVPLE